MEQKPAIEFTPFRKGFERSNSALAESIEVEFTSIEPEDRRSKQQRKHKSVQKVDREDRLLLSSSVHIDFQFAVSVPLLNCLRAPLLEGHSFTRAYMLDLQAALEGLMPKPTIDQLELALYLHLVLAQIENLEDMEQLQGVVPFQKEPWNSTNIMNPKVIMTLLQRLPAYEGPQVSAGAGRGVTVEVLANPHIYWFEQGQLKISRRYLQLGLESNGHLDAYFAPFLISKLHFDANIWFMSFMDSEVAVENYSNIFRGLAREASQFGELDEKWFLEQVEKIVQGDFHSEDLTPLLNFTRDNPWVERLLIGLQGWTGLTDKAVRLLNVFYDNCDWQLFSEFNSSIAVVGDHFSIDYLIDIERRTRSTIVYCLNAPCFDESVPLEIFSWHLPRLEEYKLDDNNFVWANLNFGNFPRTGFYSFVMFSLLDHGKEVVNKILDIDSMPAKKPSAGEHEKNFGTSMMTMRSVKGRMIVQPPHTRDLSLHELLLDSLTAELGLYRSSNFEDAMRELDRYNAEGINAVYISGVFERDTEATAEVYRKPNASPTALTHRSLACGMLGGDEGLRKLVQKAHSLGIKVMVDCSTRVSSSHMNRRYEGLRLKAVDENGRIIFHYGANGRSINYDDTTPLNYRKKEAWDLLLQEAFEVVEKFAVDGFYLDNGFEWPPVYKINSEELMRTEPPQHTPAYSNLQIFEGQIVSPTKIAGFWASPLHTVYPNPFLIRFCRRMWERYPGMILIAEALEGPDTDSRMLSVIRSGPIPRSFRLPRALAQVMGVQLGVNGQLSPMQAKHVSSLKKWYDETNKVLPKGAIVVHSTTSPVWPYLPYVFKQSTWAVLDLFFLMPMLVMTSGSELLGRAYKAKALNINFVPPEPDRLDHRTAQGFSRAGSSFMKEELPRGGKRGAVVQCSNSLVKDPSQIKYIQAQFRKEVGPQFGFNLQEIHKHYAHRRRLRKQLRLLREGRLLGIGAEHIYGIHNNVLSFALYNQEQILLVSINFNPNAVDMHYNLSSLKTIFSKYERSDIVLKLESVLNPAKFSDEHYLVSELIRSKIDAHIRPYQSIIWKLKILQGQPYIDKAIRCSGLRLQERLNRQPPAWVYSCVFFNQLAHILEHARTKTGVVTSLNTLYERCIVPYDLNISLLISKNHQFHNNKVKLEKLFGVFGLVLKNPELNDSLRQSIEGMLSGNTLGPIAFVTPEIGAWSSVGGLGVMVDELSKELARLGQQVYIITPYYQYNKKRQTNYLQRDGFSYQCNLTVKAAHFTYQFGIHTGKYQGVNYIWFHNPELFSKPYDGEEPLYVTKQLVFFALATLQAFCQLKIFPSTIVTNDWMCGFVSAYVKNNKFQQVFEGSKFMHIVHNLDPLYEGRIYPKTEEGDFGWLIGLPPHLYLQHINQKLVINPSKCALETCDNWGTVSNSYKIELLKESDLATVLWKHPHPFSFPNGIRKDERLAILRTKTPGNHPDSKFLLQQKYFQCQSPKDVPLFAFIGRVTRQKGVHLILDAVESLLYEYNHNVQFLVGGMADSKEEYGKICTDKMRYLHQRYPSCFWSNPDMFFTDGPLVNIGSDFAMMPSMFEPGGIVQHEFFCAGTPVITFCTGGLKDTVFEYNPKTQKGNGFNFLSYDLEDFKRCMRRALDCYKDKPAYEKLRENAAEAVVEEEDVARGWNNEFYRMQHKIYIDKVRVEKEIEHFSKTDEMESGPQEETRVFDFLPGQSWKPEWEVRKVFKDVLQRASRLKVKSHTFTYETKKIPRPKDVYLLGSWDNWKSKTKLNFEKIIKNYKVSIKLKPDTYYYKYFVDGEWQLTENEEKEEDQHGHVNHKVTIE